MSGYLSIKLPDDIITRVLPKLQTNGDTAIVPGSTRITEQLHTRVTRGGHTRVTRDYSATAYPELTVIKLSDEIITILLPSG